MPRESLTLPAENRPNQSRYPMVSRNTNEQTHPEKHQANRKREELAALQRRISAPACHLAFECCDFHWRPRAKTYSNFSKGLAHTVRRQRPALRHSKTVGLNHNVPNALYSGSPGSVATNSSFVTPALLPRLRQRLQHLLPIPRLPIRVT